MGGKRLSVAEWKDRAIKAHNNYYDYSLVEFVSANDVVKIICPTCGVFELTAVQHVSTVSKRGCGKCRYTRKYIKYEDFVIEANKTHKDEYTYLKTFDFSRYQDKALAICKQHGEFYTQITKHLHGKGCPHCARHLGKAEFVRRAREVHGDTYDYSHAIYTRENVNLIILCKEHGLFQQSPNNHVNGKNGCPKCSNNLKLTTEEFIKKCRLIHGDSYDYSKSVYVRAFTKVEIICPLHGSFWQTPDNHANNGRKCPKCSKRGINPTLPAVFYIYTTPTFVGFGISSSMMSRDKKHQTSFKKYNIVGSLTHIFEGSGDFIKELERSVKRNFKDNIVDTGIEGFRKEALPLDLYNDLLTYVSARYSKND